MSDLYWWNTLDFSGNLLYVRGAQNVGFDEQVEIDIKYEGYIHRQEQEIERVSRLESTRIPADLDYQQLTGLSNEVRQKLSEVLPQTIGQASRISGVTPAAVSLNVCSH